MTRVSLLLLFLLGTARAFPAEPPEAPPGARKVTLQGRVTARLQDRDVPFEISETRGDLDDSRHFEILLEPAPGSRLPALRTVTDRRGSFTLRSVAPGSYRIRVRMPNLPDNDIGELYRGPLQVRAGEARQEVAVRVPFLVMRIRRPSGEPLNFDALRLKVTRIGGELQQDWPEVQFVKGPPPGPAQMVEDPEAIRIHLHDDGWSFSWSGREPGVVIFPVVEEDQPVRYFMAASAPGVGHCLRKFNAERGKAPAELEFPMQPFVSLSGRVALKGLDAPLGAVRLRLSLVDEEERVPVRTLWTAVQGDGTYRFREAPAGSVWLAADVEGRAGNRENVLCSHREPLALREPVQDHAILLDPNDTAARAMPGEICLTVLREADGRPALGAEVELLPKGRDRPLRRAAVFYGNGVVRFEAVPPGDYVLRFLDPLRDGEPALEELPRDQVLTGVHRVVRLARPKLAPPKAP